MVQFSRHIRVYNQPIVTSILTVLNESQRSKKFIGFLCEPSSSSSSSSNAETIGLRLNVKRTKANHRVSQVQSPVVQCKIHLAAIYYERDTIWVKCIQNITQISNPAHTFKCFNAAKPKSLNNVRGDISNVCLPTYQVPTCQRRWWRRGTAVPNVLGPTLTLVPIDDCSANTAFTSGHG